MLSTSALIHAGVLFFLSSPKVFPPKEPPKLPPIQVKIVRKAEPERPKTLKTESKAKPSLARSQDKTISPVQISKGSKNTSSAGKPSYADFLPRGDISIEVGGGKGKSSDRPYTGNQKTELLAEGGELNARFDLPLVFRRSVVSGKAVAEIRKISDAEFELIALTGLPIIRAQIFQLLTREVKAEALDKISEYFGGRVFRFSVTFETTAAPYGQEFENRIEVYQDEVRLRIVRHPSAQPQLGGGIPLPDESAKRAKQHDAMALSKLLESRAYRETISRFIFSRS